MFIIDFDDTLFNTHDFKKVRLESLIKIGVTESDYQETYVEALKKNDSFNYSNEWHAELLGLRGYSVEKVLSSLEQTTGDQLQEFLFPDTVEFLEKIKDIGQSLVLLSLGEVRFQELKVKGAGISEYFDRMFMVQDSKEHVMQKLIDVGENSFQDGMWFINDKVEETLLIKNRFPQLNIVLKKSASIDEKDYQQSNVPYFKTLTEIYDYIKSNIR